MGLWLASVKSGRGWGVSHCTMGGVSSCQGQHTSSTRWYVPFWSELLVLLTSHVSVSWSGRGQWQNPKEISWNKNRILHFGLVFLFIFPPLFLPSRKEEEIAKPTHYWQASKPSFGAGALGLLLSDVLLCSEETQPQKGPRVWFSN